jgi:hypothetical protein
MTKLKSSSRKVPYDIRPRKQIERRMMAHVFHLLAESGFPISTYRYVGFGAFFFVDFILFRQLLSITDMVSIEHDINSERRVKFNRPFKDIKIEIKSSSEYISMMSRDKPYILWLDYDGPIAQESLADLEIAASILSSGSILIGTFDVDFDKADEINFRDIPPNKRAKAWFMRFHEECGDSFDPTWTVADFTATEMPNRAIQVINNAILAGLNMREGISYEPLFKFIYADGHEMLTMGGIICSNQDKRKLRQIDWEALPFVRRDFSLNPCRIDLPVLTRRERIHIDANMPCEEGWVPEEFEIEPEAIQNYREVYRYCPLYAELFS